MSDYIKQNSVVSKYSSSDTWLILNSIENGIKLKIEQKGKPLKEWGVKINRGILTGYNDAFIIDQQTKDRLIFEDPKSAEIIRPILRGRDIKRYTYTYENLYLICTFPSVNIDIESYDAVKKHLLTFGKEKLEQTGKDITLNGEKSKARKKTSNKWFELQDSISYWNDFLQQKIIYSEIVRFPQFHLDNLQYYPEATAFIMTGDHIAAIAGFLNSKVFGFAFSRFYSGGGLGETGIRYKKNFLEKMYLPLSNNLILKIENLVNQLYSSNSQTKKELIDSQIEKTIIDYLEFDDKETEYILDFFKK